MDQDTKISSPFINNDFLKTKRQERENFWDKLFKKYDIVEDDPGIKFEDIVKVQKYQEEIARYSKEIKITSHLVKYKRSSRKSKGNINTLRKRDRPRLYKSGVNKENRGRPRLSHNTLSNDTNILCEIPIEDANESSFKNPGHRKRGRPCLNKTEIKYEKPAEDSLVIRKRGRPRLNDTVKLANAYQTVIDKPENVTLNKRGREQVNYVEENYIQSVDSWNYCEKPRKRGRPRLNNNVKLGNDTFAETRSEIKPEDVGEPTLIKSGRPQLKYIEDSDDMQSVDSWDHYKIPQKYGRARLNYIKDSDDDIQSVINLDHCEKPRKRGRPRLNNSTKLENDTFTETRTEIKPEDVGEPTLIKSGRSRLKYIENSDDMQSVDSWDHYKIPQKYGRARLNYIKDSDGDVQIVNNLDNCEKPRKRGRPRLNNNIKLENEIKQEDVAETALNKRGKPRLNYTKSNDDSIVNNLSNATLDVCKKRGRPRLNNIKLETKDIDMYKNNTQFEESGRPPLKEIGINLIKSEETRIEWSMPRKRGRPRKNFTDIKIKYQNSVEDVKVCRRGRPPLESKTVKLETTIENNYKPKINQLKTNTIYYVHPLGRKELDNLYPELIENQQTKFVNNNLFIRQFQRSSIFATNVPSGDKDEMKTKVLIENKLKSDLAYKLFKRHCCQVKPNSDNNSVLFWHNAVKEELLKLSRIVSPKKLVRYMESSLAERISEWNANKAKLKDQTVGCSVTVS